LGFSASAKRSAAAASSQALNWRESRACLTRSMVKEGISMHVSFSYALPFDDLRHLEIPGARLRSIGQRRLVAQRSHRHVGAQGGGFAGLEEYLRHGFDARGIHLVKPVHMFQDAVEIRLQFGDFRVGEGQV